MFAALGWGLYLLLADGARWPFFVVVGAGVLNREVVLALLPCAGVYEWSRNGGFPWRAAAAAVGVVLGYAMFRWSIPVPVDRYTLANPYEGVPRHLALAFIAATGATAIGVAAPFVLLPLQRFFRGGRTRIRCEQRVQHSVSD